MEAEEGTMEVRATLAAIGEVIAAAAAQVVLARQDRLVRAQLKRRMATALASQHTER